LGQYLKEEARSKVWVVCTKDTGVPRYKLIQGGIESTEAIEVKEEMSESTESISDRIAEIQGPEEPVGSKGFSRIAQYVTRFVEVFASVLGTEESMSKQEAKEVLRKVCGFTDQTPATAVGKILAGLAKTTSARPELLYFLDHQQVTLSLTGRKVAKGTWALRDHFKGVRVLNFATGCFVDADEMDIEEADKPPKRTRAKVPPFNPPRLAAESRPARQRQTAPDSSDRPGIPELPTTQSQEAGEASEPVPSVPTGQVSYQEFYWSRAAQRLFEILVTECHPADYPHVIDLFVQKITGRK